MIHTSMTCELTKSAIFMESEFLLHKMADRSKATCSYNTNIFLQGMWDYVWIMRHTTFTALCYDLQGGVAQYDAKSNKVHHGEHLLFSISAIGSLNKNRVGALNR